MQIIRNFRNSQFFGHKQVAAAFIVLMATSIPQINANTEFHKPLTDDTIIADLPADVVALAAHVRASEGEPTNLNNPQPSQRVRKIMDSYRLAANSNSARAYGHTLALLRAWPSDPELPPLLRLIKADVLQHSHEFDRALIELDQLLSTDARNRSALQMKSQIHLVTAEYEAAQTLCTELATYGHTLAAGNCQAQLDGLTGSARFALTSVESLLQSQSANRNEALELNITAAGIAHRLAEHERAEIYYSTALQISPNNDYLLVNYADWLLERGRAADAAALLVHESGNSNKFELQLIYAQALLLSNEEAAATDLLLQIRKSIAIMGSRGEERPSKLLARYYLTISHDYDYAHLEAMRNWEVQKEPSDSWLLARAAVASKQWESLQQLQRWYRGAGQQDYRIDNLLVQNGLSE